MKILILIVTVLITFGTIQAQTSWNTFSTGIPSYFSVMDFGVNGNNDVLAVGSSYDASHDKGAEIYRLNTGNNRWYKVPTTGISHKFMYDAIEFTSIGLFLFAGSVTGNNAIYRSLDNGQSWSPLSTGMPSEFVVKDLTVDVDTNIYAVGRLISAPNMQGAAIYKFDQSTNSWSKLSTSGIAYNYLYTTIESTPIGLLIYARQGSNEMSIYKSTDKGQSWSSLLSGIPNNFEISDITVDIDNRVLATGFKADVASNTRAAIYRFDTLNDSWSKLNISGISFNYIYNTIEQTPIGLLLHARNMSGVKSVYLSVNPNLSIGNKVDTLELRIYPNPVLDDLVVENVSDLDIEEIMIYNGTGILVYSSQGFSTFIHTMHLSDLTSGVYILNCRMTNGYTYRYKFIKE